MIRRAHPDDADAAAGVWLRSFASALPTVRRAHSDDEVRQWFRTVLVPREQTWVAEHAGRIVGVMVLDGSRVDQLYLEPRWCGYGIGAEFVALAKELRPGGLRLVTFQVNAGAQRFYERHGFLVENRTNGADNEEREPDIHYHWPGP